LGYKLLHGNPLSVSYSPQAKIVLHWVRLAGATAWLVVLAAPYGCYVALFVANIAY
jgi:hypothetical protein